MASYNELQELFSNSDLVARTQVAVVIAAQALASGAPTAADKAWASGVFSSPVSEGKKALMAVLAANAAFSVTQITGADDAALQAKVDEIIPVLVDASAGA